MIRYLVKNNIKLMARSFTNVLLFVIAPLIVSAVLSSAFNDLMKSYEDGEIKAGYVVEGENIPDEIMDAMIKAAEENEITMTEYASGDPEELVRKNELTGLIVFKDDSYDVYKNKDEEQLGTVLEYFVGAFFRRATALPGADEIELHIEHPEFKKTIDSADYYGIVEIVYFIGCAIVCGAGIFVNEKKYRISKKFNVSNVSPAKLYLGKFIPMTVVVSAGTLISALLSIVLFGVHWAKPLLSVPLIVITAAAAVALGLMVHSLFDNVVITIIGVFGLVWFAGFYGGSFETYMFSSHPMKVKLASPIYHINRALTELSAEGHSDYVSSAFIYTGAIILVCSIIAITVETIRKRGRA